MAEVLGLDDFLGHESKIAGGRSQFLENWKRKRNPPRVDVWLHTRSPIVALWQHNIPKLVERENDDGKKVLHAWSGKWNCWETADVNKRRYYRDDDGNREMPPVICPQCLINEQLYAAYLAGEISITDEIFRYDGDEESRVLHVGGMLGLLGDKMSEDDKRAVRKAGIKMSEAWMENAVPKCNFVFTVVDDSNLADGIQITTETTLLGDKVKELIRNTKTAIGVEEGNPLRHPYAIRFEHHPNAKQFGDKYSAIRMEKLPYSDDVKALIVDTDPPDLTGIIERGNVADLRASLENAYIGPAGVVDFDKAFARAEAQQQESRADDVEAGVDAAEAAAPKPSRSKPKANPVPKGRTKLPEEDQPAASANANHSDDPPLDDDDEEIFECDECGGDVRESDTKCPHCGYVFDAAAEPEPPPPPTRRRRSSKAKSSNDGVKI